MTLLTSDLVIWSKIKIPTEQFFPGPDLPKYPKRMVIWSPSQGAGLATEWMTDQPGFQAHVVGPQSRDARVNASAEAAERLAYDVDRMMLTQIWQTEPVNGVRIVRAQRFGSGPSPLPTDTAGRAHFVCTYLIECVSGYA